MTTDNQQNGSGSAATSAILTPVVISALRTIFMMVGAFAVGRQWMTQESLDTISDPTTFATLLLAVATIGTAAYGVYTKTRLRILKDASKTLGNEGVIVAPADIADKLPKNVVPTVEEAEKVAPVRLRKHRTSRPQPTPDHAR